MSYGFIYWFLFKSLSTLISDWSSIYLLYVSWWENWFIFHCRVLKTISAGTPLLLGALNVVVYFCIYFTDHKTNLLQDVGKKAVKQGLPTKNKSYVYSWARCQKTWQQWRKPWILPERELKPGLLTAARFCQVPHKRLPWLTLQPHLEADNLPCLFTGHLITNASPIRRSESKYFNSIQVHNSSSYSPYWRWGFILSVYTAVVIHKMSQSFTIIPIDDFYIGMCLAKTGLAPVSHMGMRTFGWYIPSNKLDKYAPCYFKEQLVVHRFLPADIQLCDKEYKSPIWNVVIQRIKENQTVL